LAFRVARTEGDPSLAALIMAAAAAKLLMAFVRFWIAYGPDQGRTDAVQYDAVGKVLAPQFRRFDFSTEIGSLVGTGFVKYLTGLVYAVFGYGRTGGFVVYAWLGFLGFLLLTRAFRIGLPDGDLRRYTILVLFLPSLLFWPAIIGKEAWMLLAIGLASYGIAGLFRGRSTAAVPFVLGTGAMFLVRPHIALLVLASLLVAVAVRRTPSQTYATPMIRLLTLVLVLALGTFIAGRTASFFERTAQVEGNSINETLTLTAEKSAEETTEAGSAFDATTVSSPIDMIPAFVTVMFRPFPHEASSLTALIAAAEGVLLIGIFVASRQRLRSIPRLVRGSPYLAYSMAYIVIFVFAFSSFSNFGIIARQRVQAMPFLLVLVALPRFHDLLARAPAAAAPVDLAVAPRDPVPAYRGTRRRLRPPTEHPRTAVSSGGAFPAPPRPSA
jgi:hypothetical protein